MELAAFEKANGPPSVHLDEVLKKMNMERQAYHGKSFIGNHLHTCCKVTQGSLFSHKIQLNRCSFLFGRKTTSLNYAVLW